MSIAAFKTRLSSGPVGSKSIQEKKCLAETMATEVLFFNTGNDFSSRTYGPLDFVVLQTDQPVNVQVNGDQNLVCSSLLVLDAGLTLFSITPTDFDTTVHLVLGRRS